MIGHIKVPEDIRLSSEEVIQSLEDWKEIEKFKKKWSKNKPNRKKRRLEKSGKLEKAKVRKINHVTGTRRISTAQCRENLEMIGLDSDEVRRLKANSVFLGDKCALAANKLLSRKYPDVNGFEAVTLYEVPHLRTKASPTAANLLYSGNSEHFVATLCLKSNFVNYFDSLHPGSKPSKDELKQITKCYMMDNNKKLTIISHLCQKQKNNDCLCHAVMNLDISLSGFDVAKVAVNNSEIRKSLLHSFEEYELKFNYENCQYRGAAKVYTYKL